ncbi:MAG TPA: sigma-70 family RNA polymerase sigma factor [Polyangiaceae bacterium]
MTEWQITMRYQDNSFRESRLAIESRVRNAWPNLGFDIDAFVERLRTLDVDVSNASSIEFLAIEDLALAFACSVHDSSALSAFASEYDQDLERIGTRYRFSTSELNDLRQTIWDRLFVGTDGAKKILEYRGNGSLRVWYRVVATRLACDSLRKIRPTEQVSTVSEIEALQLVATDLDPELSVIHRNYSREFRAAFEFAVASLDSSERKALRYYYVLGLAIDQIAVAMAIHRATAARRVTRARERLYSKTRERLQSILGAHTHEVESILRLYKDRFSITLSRLLE